VTKGEGGLFGEGVMRFDDVGVTLAHDLTRRLVIHADDPLSARSAIEQTYAMEIDGRRFRIETRSELGADHTAFRLTGTLAAYEDEVLVAERRWDEHILREHL
jgi:hypothetical protein